MDKRSLTDAQYETLVDFVHRWGLDHPALIAEMADHYGEKALDLMDRGYRWEAVLNSFKTKRTYHALRRMERNYRQLVKQAWKAESRNEMRAALNFRTVMPLLLVGVAAWMAMQHPLGATLVKSLVVVKSVVVLGIFSFYQTFHSRTKHIPQVWRFWGLLFLDFWIGHRLFLTYTEWTGGQLEPLGGFSLWFWTLAIVVSIYMNVVALRMAKRLGLSVAHIPAEVYERLKQKK